MFKNKEWPEGFEFGCCKKCNSESSDDDLIVSVLARSDAITDSGDDDGRLLGLLRNLNQQIPSFFTEMIPTTREARNMNRSTGVKPPAGLTHQEAGAVKIPDRAKQAVHKFSSKLSKAIYYKECNKIFPLSGELALHWFTNADIYKHGTFASLRDIAHIPGEAPVTQRNRQLLLDQFQYKWSVDEENNFFLLQSLFRNAFGIVVFGSVTPGKISSIIDNLRETSGPSEGLVLLA